MLPHTKLKESHRVYFHHEHAPIQVSYANCFDIRVFKRNNTWIFRSDSGFVHFETNDVASVTIEQLYKLTFP